jgi:uncharacterized membrane protein
MPLRKPLIESALLMTLTVLAVAAVLETSGVPRALGAVLLVFVLPGRAFLAGWFPRRWAEAPGNILLMVLLSIAAAVIGGLLLNLLPQGLQPQTWALWLGGITLFNGAVALLRSGLDRTPDIVGQGWALHPGQALMILLAGVIVAGSLLVARGGALNQPRPGFTQLWMIQGETPQTAQIGLRNEEGKTVAYWLVVRQGETPIQAYYQVQVDAGGTWTVVVPLPANVNTQQPIEAQLYRSDQPDSVYRNVTLWVSEVGSR